MVKEIQFFVLLLTSDNSFLYPERQVFFSNLIIFIIIRIIKMTHPIGKYINQSQDHELNYWLREKDFSQSKKNRDSLLTLINDAKEYNKINSNAHLSYKQLNEFFEENKSIYYFDK